MEKDIQLPQFIIDFMDVFRKSGYEIFVVGGPVRDLILQRPIDNWDFATNATPEEIVELFDNAKYENAYGTVIVPLHVGNPPDDGEPFEMTTICEVTPYRKEGKYSDSRHPDNIEWADTIEEDVKRRDFTINALAYNGEQLIDVVNGIQDMQDKLIRAVGDPDKRFREDALRLMRAVRFAAQLEFEIEKQTRKALSHNASHIKNISWERIRDEFLKILASNHPAEGILTLKDTGILKHILPELEACFGVEQQSPGRHHIHGVGEHLIETLRHCPSDDPITRFAALIHDIGKPETRNVDEEGITTFYNHEIVGANIANDIGERFRLSKKDRHKLVKLVRYHMFSVSENQADKAIRRFVRRVGKENIEDMLDLRTGDRLGSGVPESSWRTELYKKRIEDVQKKPFTVHDLKISGNEVMEELGIKPGPQVGAILNQLFEKVADGDVKNEPKALKEELKNIHVDE